MHWWDKQLPEYQALRSARTSVRRGSHRWRGRRKPQDYPFWLLTARSMQYSWGANVGVQVKRSPTTWPGTRA